MIDFKLPDIGEGLSEAELLEWIVAVGDEVREGDEVAVVSTDKVNVELTAPASGRIAALFGTPGDVIDVGTLIMQIEPAAKAAAATATPTAQTGTDTPSDAAAVTGPGATARVTTSTAKAGQPAAPVQAAPIVRRYAAEKGINLGEVTGTGPGAQILRSDIDAHLAAKLAVSDLGPVPTPSSARRRLKLRGARLAAAQGLTQAHRTAVTTTIQFEVNADQLLEESASDTKNQPGGAKITPTVVVAHCLIRALSQNSQFNATVDDANQELLVSDDINLGIAVNTEDGLKVPVLKAAQNLPLDELASAITHLAEQARAGKLGVAQFRDSSFTLSSTGGLESATITGTTPIINWPNVAILWVSRVSLRPRVIDGCLEAGPVMACSLSFDHRYLNGADGLKFINDFSDACQTPAK